MPDNNAHFEVLFVIDNNKRIGWIYDGIWINRMLMFVVCPRCANSQTKFAHRFAHIK
jgi:hypothetical protein